MNCLYALSYDEGLSAICLRVHRDFIRATPDISSETFLGICYERLYQSLQKVSFYGSLRQTVFGFSGALKRASEDRGFVKFIASLPPKEQRKCSICGKGQNKETNEPCRSCYGTGITYGVNWDDLYPIIVSLGIFFKLAEIFNTEYKTSSQQHQLMLLETRTQKQERFDGWAINGHFSDSLVEWLKQFWKGSCGSYAGIYEVNKAMENAWNYSCGQPCLTGLFSAYTDKTGSLVLDIGQASVQQNRSSPRFGSLGGYDITSDNMDWITSQLVALVGLAKICELAIKDVGMS